MHLDTSSSESERKHVGPILSRMGGAERVLAVKSKLLHA